MKAENQATILVVDDSPNNVRLVFDLLKDSYQILFSTNGEKALRIANQQEVDLILLDVMMPEMDGFEVCRRLKAKPNTAGIPIIFLTAKTETEDLVEGFEAGAADYVTKPFNAPELIARVATQMALKQGRDALEKAHGEQSELLHILCHDFVNVLAGTQIMGQMMTPENIDRMRPTLLSTVGNGLKLIDLVRAMRVLEIKPLTLSSVNLFCAIRESQMLLEHRFTEKAIRLQVEVDKTYKVQAEPTSLVNSVLNNLLTNAIKFSVRGAIIRITAQMDGNYLQLIIQDQGVGIPADLLVNLFDVSKATSRPGTDGESGTGFGMPLVRKFIHAYGGTIAVASKEQEAFPQESGTTITMQLPI